MRRILSKAMAWLRKAQTEDEFNSEIQHHLELLEERFLRRGMSAKDARSAARRAFGGREPLKEHHREARSFVWVEHLQQDFRYAVRMAFRNKAWALLTIVTLSLGIGPLTALYSFFDRAFLTALPVPQAEELVTFYSYYRDLRIPRSGNARATALRVSQTDLQEMRASNQTLSHIIAFDNVYEPADVIAQGALGHAWIQFVSGNYFPTLQLHAIHGRLLQPDEDSATASPVVAISELYWERVFSRDPNVLGASITIDRKPYTIVGVWPARFVDATGTQSMDQGGPKRPEIMIPLVHDDPKARYRGPRSSSIFLSVMGRMKPGVTVEQVQANFETIFNKDEGTYRRRLLIRPATPGLWAVSNEFAAMPSWAPLLFALIISFFAIPLILSCNNVATFLLARAEDRRVEIGMRLAIGASRGRLVRQLLTESVLLAVLGGFAGLLVAYWWTKLFANPPFSVYSDLSLNWRAFCFASLMALPVGIVCGLLSARAAAADATSMLRSFSLGISRAPSSRTRHLIGVQVAMSLLGLISVGLMVRTIQSVRMLDVGFDTERIAIFTVDPGSSMTTYDGAQVAELNERIIQALASLRGVESVSFSDQPILTGKSPVTGVYARSSSGQLQTRDVNWLTVHPNFLRTLEIPLKLGRSFSRDDPATPQRVVVNARFAQAFFANDNPIGRHFGKDLKSPAAYEIVGVAADAKPVGAASDAPLTVYVPTECCTTTAKTFQVRTSGNPAALLPTIRNVLTSVDANLAVTKLTTPKAEIEEAYLSGAATIKFILNYYAGLSTVLAMTGLFGLMSHVIAGRTKEIGIRIALGAHPRRMLFEVIGQTLRTIIPGVFVGLIAAMAVGRFAANLLYDVPPHDPITILASVASMILIAAAAGYIPARRASRVDPIVALRHE